MIERSDRVDLADNEPRCWRDTGCGHTESCARRRAALVKGAPLMDGLVGSTTYMLGWCTMYLPVKLKAKGPALTSSPPKPPPRGIV